jgi:hypothetical protein
MKGRGLFIMATSTLDARKTELQDIMDRLEQGVKDVFESENYKRYLSVMSTFHKYSINNSLLIMLQKPDASLVAGYQSWLNRKRQVQKGERGIRILAPQNYTIKNEVEVPVKDNSGNVQIGKDGKPVTELKNVESKHTRFVPVSVFDVSQTTGEPLPSLLKVSELNGVVPERDYILSSLRTIAGIPISIIPIAGGSKGYYDSAAQLIAIKEGMSDMQTIKTGIHETAHKMLHNPEEDILAATDTKNMKEVQAESIAYVVADHFGLDTSDYSFGYIANWSTGKQLNELKASLATVQKTATIIIDEVEKLLEQYRANIVTVEKMPYIENAMVLLIKNNSPLEYAFDTTYMGFDTFDDCYKSIYDNLNQTYIEEYNNIVEKINSQSWETKQTGANEIISENVAVDQVPAFYDPSLNPQILPENIEDRKFYLLDRSIDRLKSLLNVYQKGDTMSDITFKSELEDTSNLINVHTDGWQTEITGGLLVFQNSINEIIKNMGLNGLSINDAANSVSLICNQYDNDKVYDIMVASLKALNDSYDKSLNDVVPMQIEKYKDTLDNIIVKTIQDLNGKQPSEDLKVLLEGLDKITVDVEKGIANELFPNYDSLMGKVKELYEIPILLDRPVVTVTYSEHEAFKKGDIYSLSAFDNIMGRYDRQVVNLKNEAKAKGDYYPYFKTDFRIDFPMNGTNHIYTGRQDIGDGEGSLIEHIKSTAEYFLSTENASYPSNVKEKEDSEWILSTFVPYLENVKELEMKDGQLAQLIESTEMLKAEASAAKEISPILKVSADITADGSSSFVKGTYDNKPFEMTYHYRAENSNGKISGNFTKEEKQTIMKKWLVSDYVVAESSETKATPEKAAAIKKKTTPEKATIPKSKTTTKTAENKVSGKGISGRVASAKNKAASQVRNTTANSKSKDQER